MSVDTAVNGVSPAASTGTVAVSAPGEQDPPALVSSLRRVAAAMNSGSGLDVILGSIVDEAKHVTRSDKTVLCMVEEQEGHLRVDPQAVFVRGRREEHPEAWWRGRVERVASHVLSLGAARTVGTDGTWLSCAPVRAGREPVGVLAAMNVGSRPFSKQQSVMLSVLATMAGFAIENSRLATKSRSALLAQERERLSMEMHDGLAQYLCALQLQLESCRRDARTVSDDLASRIGKVGELARECSSELRRHIYDLRPGTLERLGLADAIAARLDEMTGEKLRGRLLVSGHRRVLAPEVEDSLYRLAQECLSNVVKHAQATKVDVRLRYLHRSVELHVEDDGTGLGAEDGAKRPGCGLRNMRERADTLGGQLRIGSGQMGGTYVVVTMPC